MHSKASLGTVLCSFKWHQWVFARTQLFKALSPENYLYLFVFLLKCVMKNPTYWFNCPVSPVTKRLTAVPSVSPWSSSTHSESQAGLQTERIIIPFTPMKHQEHLRHFVILLPFWNYWVIYLRKKIALNRSKDLKVSFWRRESKLPSCKNTDINPGPILYGLLQHCI